MSGEDAVGTPLPAEINANDPPDGGSSAAETDTESGPEVSEEEDELSGVSPELLGYVTAARLVEGVSSISRLSLRPLYQALARGDFASWVSVPAKTPFELQIPLSYWTSMGEQDFLSRFSETSSSAISMPAADVILAMTLALNRGRLFQGLTSDIPANFRLRFDTDDAPLTQDQWRLEKVKIREAIRKDLDERSALFTARRYDLTLWGPDVFRAFGPAPAASSSSGRKGGRPRKYSWDRVHELLLRTFFADPSKITREPAILYKHVYQLAQSEGISLENWPPKDEFPDHLRKVLKRRKTN